MLISLIVAMASNRVIGYQGDIPWKISGEQKMFKKITLGHVVIMGRKTYESLARPLPGRTNIVVTRQTDYQAPGCIIAQDFDGAIKSCPTDENEAFIIGGGQLYHEALSLSGRIWVIPFSPRFLKPTLRLQNPNLSMAWSPIIFIFTNE